MLGFLCGSFTSASRSERSLTMVTTESAPEAPVFQKPTAIESAFNRFFGFLVGIGAGTKHNYLLQVRGS